MKQIAIIVLLTISSFAYAQNLKGKLQGDWVCTKILDLNGKAATGKFGKSDEYLKFSFIKDNLLIAEAPFDRGITLPVKFGDDFIDLFPDAIYDLPERIYTIKFIDKDSLVLKASDDNNKTIEYHFANQTQYKYEPIDDSKIIDNGTIIIKHLKSSKEAKGANRVSEYRIGNEKKYLFPRPIFTDSRSSNFGFYFSINFKFPKTYQLEKVSDELIIDFDITEEGVTNVKIVKGLDDEINASVLKIIEGTNKKWEPLKVDGQPVITTMRFHLIFYLGISIF